MSSILSIRKYHEQEQPMMVGQSEYTGAMPRSYDLASIKRHNNGLMSRGISFFATMIAVVCCSISITVSAAAYTLSSTTPSYAHRVSWSNSGGEANSYSFLVPFGQTAHLTLVRDSSDYAGANNNKSENRFYVKFNGVNQSWTSIENGVYRFERDVTANDTLLVSCYTAADFYRKTWIEYINGKAVPRYQDIYYTNYYCAYGYKVTLSYTGSDGGGGTGENGGGSSDSSYDLVFPASGGSKAVVKLDNLSPYYVTGYVEPPYWLSVEMRISGNVGTHYIVADENNTLNERTATVEFNISNGTKKYITVKQGAGPSSSPTGTSTSSYTIRLHRNNSANDGATAGRTMTVKASRSLPTISELGWARSGYTFLGWSSSSSATSATYSNGQSVKNLTTTKGATVHLYAVWKKNAPVTYTLRLHRNNSANDGATAGRTLTVNVSRKLPTLAELKWTRSGYTFRGWALGATASNAVYFDGQSVKNLSTVKGSMVHLYAVWESNVQTYKICLCRNNSANDGATAIRTMTIGKSRKLPTIAELGWARRGYRFAGWDGYSESAGNLVRYSDGQTVFNVTTRPNAILYFYAAWR